MMLTTMQVCKPSSLQARCGPVAALPQVVPRPSLRCAAQPPKKTPKASVTYGNDWYEQTRQAALPRRTVREEIEYRRQANLAANNGKERKDLYTDNWDGSEYKGSSFNILTLVGLLFVLTPVLGLAFAYWSYGTLWG